MVDRMTLQPPVSSLLVACPLEPFWQLTMGSCMSCWSWCAKDRKDEPFPYRLWVARDGVSYHHGPGANGTVCAVLPVQVFLGLAAILPVDSNN